MRNILICKQCKHFGENGMRFDGYVYEGLHFGREMKYGRNKRMHTCHQFDGLWVTWKLESEYYLMECGEACPYYVEQYISLLKKDFREPDYGIARFFKKTRICQHCGNVIPRKDFVCPTCGYEEFRTITKWMTKTPLERVKYGLKMAAFPVIISVAYVCGKLKHLALKYFLF